jgi:hypothetical protein
MKKPINLIMVMVIVFSFTITSFLSGQNTQISNLNYDRSSFSFHYAEFSPGTSFSKEIYDLIGVPEKFDDNTIPNNVIKLNSSILPIEQDIRPILEQAIRGQRVVNQILASILLDPEGVPTIEKLAQRGEYNASDKDFLIAKSTQEGTSVLRQYGLENMLSNIYFLVVIPYSFHYEYSDEERCYGYKTIYKELIYHIDLNNLLDTNFWELFWWEGKNPEKEEEFMNYPFPIKCDYNITGSLFVPKEKYTESAIQYTTLDKIISDGLLSYSKVNEDLQVKNSVFSVSPIASKIGEKEGLHVDDLFKVTENRQRSDGSVEAVKVGHVRVKRVADNRQLSSGDSEMSLFYKAPSRTVKKGMTLIEVPETGTMTGVEMGYRGGFIPFNDSDSWGYIGLTIDQITHIWKGNRVAASYNYILNLENGVNLNMFTAEVKQEIQMNVLSIIPGIGFGYAFNKSYGFKTYGATASLKIAINLGKYFQINAGPRYYYFLDCPLNGLYMSASLRLFGF